MVGVVVKAKEGGLEEEIREVFLRRIKYFDMLDNYAQNEELE